MKRLISIILILLMLTSTAFADYISPKRTVIYNQGTDPTCGAYAIKTLREMQTGKKVDYKDIYKYQETEGGLRLDKTLTSLNLNYTLIPNRSSGASVKKGVVIKTDPTVIQDGFQERIDKIKEAIKKDGAVIIVIQVDNTIHSLNRKQKGIVSTPDKITDKYHGMVIIGWKTIDGQDYWICQNSWGWYWGDRGLCYIPFDYPLIHQYYLINKEEK